MKTNKSKKKPQDEFREELEITKARLAEAQETLRAIRTGEVDALVMETPGGDHIFTLKGADYSYRVLVETMSEGTAMVSPDGTIFYCNQRFADIIRTPLENTIGSPLRRFIQPSDMINFEVFCDVRLRDKNRESTELVFRASDGSSVPVMISVNSLEDMDAPGSICLVVTDISERKRAEEELQKAHDKLEERVEERTRELRESEQKFRSVVENSMDAILIAKPDGSVLSANLAACRILGMSEEEIINKGRAGLIDDNDPDYKKAIQERSRMGKVRAELSFIRKDGSRFPAEFTSSIYANDHGDVLVNVIFRDITDRKKAQEALQKANDELEAKVHELESFSYTVSHDLRSPLRAIDGFADMLLDEIGDKLDPDTKRKFNVISSNSKKMAQLIDDLLSFSRTGRAAISVARINVQDLVDDVCKELRAGTPDRNIEFKVGVLPPVSGDRILLRQVLSNLLDNAVKFTRQREHAIIEVIGSNSGELNTYCIRDNGVGFDMHYYDKLFEIFRRLHSEKEYEGTGVGLAIVKRIIERHGGKIWAESKHGEGATFCFALPS